MVVLLCKKYKKCINAGRTTQCLIRFNQKMHLTTIMIYRIKEFQRHILLTTVTLQIQAIHWTIHYVILGSQKYWVELYLHTSTPSWPLQGRLLPFLRHAPNL